jgi:hypothetical protein
LCGWPFFPVKSFTTFEFRVDRHLGMAQSPFCSRFLAPIGVRVMCFNAIQQSTLAAAQWETLLVILASAVPPRISLYLRFEIRFLLYLPIVNPTQYALVLITLTRVSTVGPVSVTSPHLCALIPLGN